LQSLNVVSLFDGISCGRVALEKAGYAVSSYIAYEIDKYAKSVSRYNYPDIVQLGDVLDADFSKFVGYDIVMGGSPCTFWSIAKSGREVDKNGKGWTLFMCFVDAVRQIKPRYFLYENVASMPSNIKDYISEELGCVPILINSALVSAQNRNRFYWTNIEGISQPHDKGILLQDVLEIPGLTARDKSYCIDASYYKGGNSNLSKQSGKRLMVYKPTSPQGQHDKVYSVQDSTISLHSSYGISFGNCKINLPDGYYTIRKLTPIEAERLQTLPDNYTALGVDDEGKTVKISNTQRYKTIGNGWTTDVIAHILSHIPRGR